MPRFHYDYRHDSFLGLHTAAFGNLQCLAQMLSIGVPALRIISLSFLLAGFDIIIISVMQALGHGVISLIISMMRQLVVLLPAAFLFSKIWGLGAVWIAFPLAECVSLCVTLLFWRKVYRNEIQPLYNAER